MKDGEDEARIVAKVRAAIRRGELSDAESLLCGNKDDYAASPEGLEALSWLARGFFSAQQFEKAADYALTTHRSAIDLLNSLSLNSEPSLASALGSSIEVIAQVKERRGQHLEAIRFLEQEREKYGVTSIGTRIQKNINLLTLEGQQAPGLEVVDWLGPKPRLLAEMRGHPVLLFFWAHYCEDSRAQAPALMQLVKDFASSDLALVGPTRLYGYLDEHSRKPVAPQQEMSHIQAVLIRDYASLPGMPVPISQRNFDIYGVSTTPTLVVIGGSGEVSLYHPGELTLQDLRSQIQRVLP